MKQRVRRNLLGVYDLVLAAGAISTGILMIWSKYGVFAEYPKEWLTKVPFDSWGIPGVIAIVLFGLGNIMAAMFSFRKNNNKAWIASALMGGIFLASIIAQVVVLGEWYMATVEFLIFCIIQLCLCVYAFVGLREISGKVI